MMIIITILMAIYTGKKLVDTFTDIRYSPINRALMPCAILFLLSLVSTAILYNYLSVKRLLDEAVISIDSFFHSSNHLIISLDIIFFYSMMMLILYQTFKLSKLHSVE